MRLQGSHKRRKVPGLAVLLGAPWERGNYRSLLGGSRASRSGLGPGTESGASFGAFFGACGVAEPAKACRGRRRSSWSPLATIGVSWEALGHLGVVLGGFLARRGLRESRRLESLRTLLEASWGCPDASQGPFLGHFGALRGSVGGLLGRLGAILGVSGRLGARFGPSWAASGAQLGLSWGSLEALLGRLGAFLGRLGALLGRLRAILGSSGAV